MQPTIRMGTSEDALEVASRAENAFNQVLTETGARALFYYLETNHGMSASDIVNRPGDFVYALAAILGDYGSSLLMHRVREAAQLPST